MVNVYQSTETASTFSLVQRIAASQIVDKNNPLEPGYFVLEWEGRIPKTSKPSDVQSWVTTWVNQAKSQNDFLGEVGDIYWDVTALWVVDNPDEPHFIRIFLPIKITDEAQIPTFDIPDFGFSLVPVAPAWPLIAWMFISLSAAAAAVSAVMILSPGEARQVAATVGLLLHPESETLKDIANEQVPESKVGQLLDTTDNVAKAAAFIAAIWFAQNLLNKTTP